MKNKELRVTSSLVKNMLVPELKDVTVQHHEHHEDRF